VPPPAFLIDAAQAADMKAHVPCDSNRLHLSVSFCAPGSRTDLSNVLVSRVVFEYVNDTSSFVAFKDLSIRRRDNIRRRVCRESKKHGELRSYSLFASNTSYLCKNLEFDIEQFVVVHFRIVLCAVTVLYLKKWTLLSVTTNVLLSCWLPTPFLWIQSWMVEIRSKGLTRKISLRLPVLIIVSFTRSTEVRGKDRGELQMEIISLHAFTRQTKMRRLQSKFLGKYYAQTAL
jgi:hypothetical protein